MSDDAFLSVDLLKPAPGVRNATYSLLSILRIVQDWDL
jgi:inosine/xanthosine triphosphate pyrophosphatase family protein